MDRGAWWATVHGAQSQTRLNWTTTDDPWDWNHSCSGSNSDKPFPLKSSTTSQLYPELGSPRIWPLCRLGSREFLAGRRWAKVQGSGVGRGKEAAALMGEPLGGPRERGCICTSWELIGLPWWLRWQRICLQCRRLRSNPWVWKTQKYKLLSPTPEILGWKSPGISILMFEKHWLIFLTFFLFFSFIFISWRLITLQYCSGFCHTLTWFSHGFTWKHWLRA